LDILSAIEKILSYIEGMSESEFRKDDRTIDAVIRQLITLGEAAARVSDEVQTQHPDVPWRIMRNQRNFLAHVYFDVNPTKVWHTVQNSLPPLVPQLRAILNTLEK